MKDVLEHSRRDFIKQTAALAALSVAPSPLALLAEEEQSNKIQARGYAAKTAGGVLTAWDFQRRALRDDDVLIEVLYTGICHSDIHQARGEWGPLPYPFVPGHEIAGRVVRVGKKVTRFKAGDHAGVGFISDSCGECENCTEGHEQYCDRGETVFTAGGPDKHLGGITQGGYSNYIVTKEHFVLNIPSSMELKTVAPMLCAGATTYSELLSLNVGPGSTIGIAGIGGLGHMAVKIAVAKGANVVAFTTSPSKVDDIKRFGAKEVVVVDSADKLKPYRRKLDYLVSTIPAQYDMASYIETVKRDGTYTQIGIPATGAMQMSVVELVMSRVKVNGHFIGGLQETQDVINFCAKHNIAPEVETIDITKVNEAFNNVVAKKARYRYVIDMKSLG
jgi:alcohol dehydrogenase (NADP+)